MSWSSNNSYVLLKQALMAKYPMCEVCGVRPSIEVNHCLYHVHKRRFNAVFDSFENCQAVCHECHMSGRAHWRSTKEAHWKKRVSEGFDMLAWNETVPTTRREGWG